MERSKFRMFKGGTKTNLSRDTRRIFIDRKVVTCNVSMLFGSMMVINGYKLRVIQSNNCWKGVVIYFWANGRKMPSS